MEWLPEGVITVELTSLLLTYHIQRHYDFVVCIT